MMYKTKSMVSDCLKVVCITSQIVLSFFPVTAAYAQVHNECVTCHISDSPVQQSAYLNQQLPNLCITCHPGRSGSNEHIIDVPPPAELQSKWSRLPLVDGMITCTTCHDSHSHSPAMLHMSTNDLCAACHQY